MKKPSVGDRHVIFMHGFFCNDGFWLRLSSLLVNQGFTVSGVEMPAAFASIDEFSRLLEVEIERCVAKNANTQLTLIGFSMGGLACRQLPRETQKRLGLITLYTPHRGTQLARLIGYFGASNGRDMTVGSEWLKQCNAQPNYFRSAVSIWSSHDTIVLPAQNAESTFHSLRLIGRGHLSAAIDKKLHRHVIRLLKAGV